MKFLPCGDTAFSVQFGEKIDRKLCMKVLQLQKVLAAAALPGVLESVPSYRSLLVHYDPLITSQEKLRKSIDILTENPKTLLLQPKRWFFPVCFAPEFAWDLPEVSGILEMTETELISLCTSTELFVYMIGFSMGLLYLGDFPKFSSLLRRVNPRTRLEKGAVAVAQGMAVIYPVVSPGGWNIIGNTPVSLFDITRTPPSPFTPGDRIVLQRVEAKEHQKIAQAVERGSYQLRYEEIEETE